MVEIRTRQDGSPYLSDETETRNIIGTCSAVVRPNNTDEVAAVVQWAYERGITVVRRGGGTGSHRTRGSAAREQALEAIAVAEAQGLATHAMSASRR